MASVSTDRRFGVNSGQAVKVPCKAATTANITLSGEQTIDGISCVTGDRVLAKNQTSSVNNGIYVVDTGAWQRALDFDGSFDVVPGTIVSIYSGTVSGNKIYRVTGTAPIIPGSSAISFDFVASSESGLISHLPSGTDAQATTVYEMLEREPISIFSFMTEAQRNDVMSGTASVDVSSAVQKAFDKAYGSGTVVRPVVGWGKCRLETKIDARAPIVGYGPQSSNKGFTFVWHGAGDKVFEFATYDSGWIFERFKIDTTNVTSDVTMMYFTAGLNGASFRDIEFRGAHSGASFGGTYRNHDGIHVVGGSAPSTKYDMSQNRFERVFWLRNRRGLTVTDPSTQGPGNGNTFDGCFGWVSEWVIKLTGANNAFVNNEFNYESGGRALILAGQYAVGWSIQAFNTQSASSSDQPISIDTAGSACPFEWQGGTIEEANGGGYPSLYVDAGPTGGKVIRPLIHGVNNADSTVLRADQILLGQAALSNNSYLYDKGDWTPAFTGLTVVLGGGSVAYSGEWTRIGKVVFWMVKIVPAGGATTESVAGTTRINNLPFTQVDLEGTCTAVNAGTVASYGVGSGSVGGTSMFTPTWAAAAESISISGFFFTDGV